MLWIEFLRPIFNACDALLQPGSMEPASLFGRRNRPWQTTYS